MYGQATIIWEGTKNQESVNNKGTNEFVLLDNLMLIVTVRQRNCEKVMFLIMFICFSICRQAGG